MESSIYKWLLEQAPVIIVMGIGITWLAKKLTKSEQEKQDLAKEVVKSMTNWEAKATKLGEIDEKFKAETISLLNHIVNRLQK